MKKYVIMVQREDVIYGKTVVTRPYGESLAVPFSSSIDGVFDTPADAYARMRMESCVPPKDFRVETDTGFVSGVSMSGGMELYQTRFGVFEAEVVNGKVVSVSTEPIDFSGKSKTVEDVTPTQEKHQDKQAAVSDTPDKHDFRGKDVTVVFYRNKKGNDFCYFDVRNNSTDSQEKVLAQCESYGWDVTGSVTVYNNGVFELDGLQFDIPSRSKSVPYEDVASELKEFKYVHIDGCIAELYEEITL